MNSDNSTAQIIVRDYTRGETFITSRSNIWEAMNALDPFFARVPCWQHFPLQWVFSIEETLEETL